MVDPLTGHEVRAGYLWEDNGFRNAPTDSTYKIWGHDAQVTAAEGGHEAVRVFNPNSNRAADIIEQAFQGSFSLESVITNPWWLRGVLGTASTSGTSAPYTHTYQGGPPDPLRIAMANEDNEHERTLMGCVISDIEVSVEVEGNATLSIDGAYAKEKNPDESGNIFTQPTPEERPMTFAQATLDVGATTYQLVQSASLSLSLNTEMIRELGDRYPVTFSPKVFDVSLDFSRVRKDNADIDRFYDGTDTMSQTVENEKTLDLLFDNGESGSDKNSLSFEMSGAIPNELSEEGLGDEESDVEVSMTEMGQDLKVVAENSTSSAK